MAIGLHGLPSSSVYTRVNSLNGLVGEHWFQLVGMMEVEKVGGKEKRAKLLDCKYYK